MPVVDVKNLAGKKVGTVELADDVFSAKVNPHLLHEAVRHYLAGQRAGTHKTKDKSEVSGSGKKLWKQKGTGRARIGSIRSPLWRHGGTVHGPVPRNYEYALPKKMIWARCARRFGEAGGREADGRGRLDARIAQDQAVPPGARQAGRRNAHDSAGGDRRECESRARQPQSGRRDAGAADGARNLRPDAARPPDAFARSGGEIEPRAFGEQSPTSRSESSAPDAAAARRRRRRRQRPTAKKEAAPQKAKKPAAAKSAKTARPKAKPKAKKD